MQTHRLTNIVDGTDRFNNVVIHDDGTFEGTHNDFGRPTEFHWGFPLFLIHAAWERDCDFEDEADGFGVGKGTMGGDWSGIRDSSDEALARMLEKALNFLFP